MKIIVNVNPGSSKEEIIKLDPTSYKVYLKKHAVDGKANKELERLLKKYFKSKVKIIKGHTSRNKLVEVEE